MTSSTGVQERGDKRTLLRFVVLLVVTVVAVRFYLENEVGPLGLAGIAAAGDAVVVAVGGIWIFKPAPKSQ